MNIVPIVAVTTMALLVPASSASFAASCCCGVAEPPRCVSPFLWPTERVGAPAWNGEDEALGAVSIKRVLDRAHLEAC